MERFEDARLRFNGANAALFNRAFRAAPTTLSGEEAVLGSITFVSLALAKTALRYPEWAQAWLAIMDSDLCLTDELLAAIVRDRPVEVG